MKGATLFALFGAAVMLMVVAQPGFCADVVGTVADSQAHPVANVRIVVTNRAGKFFGKGRTDATGRYRITSLAPGVYVYTLDPLASGFRGGNAVAPLRYAGLTVNWEVSKVGPALAFAKRSKSKRLAQRGAGQLAGDPFGYSPGEFASIVTLGAGLVAAGVVGGYGAAGGFSGGKPTSPSM